jgi:hypothetical protein
MSNWRPNTNAPKVPAAVLRKGAIPAGRITSNAGAWEHKPATSTINCTVSGLIRDSNDSLGAIDKASRGVGQSARDIASMLEQQSRASQEVAQSMERMSALTEENLTLQRIER